MTTGANVKVFIPTNGTLGNTWTTTGFNDSSWISGTNGVGFEVPTVSTGFNVRMVDTNGGSDGQIDTITEATSILDGTFSAGSFTIATDTTAAASALNYGNPGTFTADLTFPNGVGPGTANQFAAGREQFALRTTANLFIPQGTWTIDVGSDAGFRLTMGSNVTFTNRFGEKRERQSRECAPVGHHAQRRGIRPARSRWARAG